MPLISEKTSTFRREMLHKVFHEAMPLLYNHWKEIAHYKDIPLEPDVDQYIKLEQMGLIRVYTARSDAQELIGYAVFFVRPHLHYKSSVHAAQDILYVDPEHRGMGGRFIKWCDEQLREEGVQIVHHHIKAAHNFGRMLERFGYELVDLIYSRRLR